MEQAAEQDSLRVGAGGRLIRFLRQDPLAMIWAAVIVIALLAAILAPYLQIQNPMAQDLPDRFRPPSVGHLFGTDNFGRDVLSRVIWGGRISLLVGILSVAAGSVAGVVLGLISGYCGKLVDMVIMRMTDIFLSFPALLLAMAICAAVGSNIWNVVIAIAVTTAPRFCRLVRGSTLSVKKEEYVEAARALGQRPVKIILYHVFPNVLSPILVVVTLSVPMAIMIEASLSFLGIGVMPPTPTWGNMIGEGKSYLQGAPWIALFSGSAIVLVVLAFNFVGDAIRDALDPRLKGEREVGRG